MPAFNDALMGASNAVVRALLERQTSESHQPPMVTSSQTPSPTFVPTPTATSSPPNQQATSSPLLFFVALGFGVVFTNLWIIVGVKYCFRYNARNRALRMAEDGEPINMENMPRPHRRRREKKLMTMDEVNEKFPMQKYKNWVASRAQEGLPTAGGVSAPASRANSIRDVEAIVPELSKKESDSTEDRPTTSATSNPKANESSDSQDKKPSDTLSTVNPGSSENQTVAGAPKFEEENGKDLSNDLAMKHRDDDDDEDEQINAALPPECLGTSGDTCAICIDTLEDDDDVRGLTCGHAFHAGCLDPWLTSRRACCPLCKADYYTPKPRRTQTDGQLPTPPTDGDASAAGANSGSASASAPRIDSNRLDHQMNLPQPPQTAWQSLVQRSRGMFGQSPAGGAAGANQNTRRTRNAQARPRSASRPTPASPEAQQPQNVGWGARFREGFPHWRMQRNRTQNNTNVTPAQLEAGVGQ